MSTHHTNRTTQQRGSSRGLLGQISTILFQPVTFFREMPTMQHSRQWAWMAFLVVIIIGFSTIQQSNATTSNTSSTDGGNDFMMQDPFMQEMGGGFDFGGPPMGGEMPTTGQETGGNSNSSTNWEIALIAAAGFVVVWLVQALLLSEVSLFRGKAPQFGDNLQIAIWASTPLAIMAALQLIFTWTGGEIGQAGLSGLIVETPLFKTATEFGQKVLFVLSSNLTLFWLWSLILLYIGARNVLKGHVFSSAAVVIAWVTVFTLAPILTNQVNLPTQNDTLSMDTGFPMEDDFSFGGDFPMDEMPFEGEMFPEGDMGFPDDMTPFEEDNSFEDLPLDSETDSFNESESFEDAQPFQDTEFETEDG